MSYETAEQRRRRLERQRSSSSSGFQPSGHNFYSDSYQTSSSTIADRVATRHPHLRRTPVRVVVVIKEHSKGL